MPASPIDKVYPRPEIHNPIAVQEFLPAATLRTTQSLRKHTVEAHEYYPAKWQSVHPSKLRAVSQAFRLLHKSFWMDFL